jgi:hypothetical protein
VVEIQDKLDKERKNELESSMKKITTKNINTNIEKKCPADKFLNPNTNRCIRICGKGETRNKKNRCIKKNRKSLKKSGKSGK